MTELTIVRSVYARCAYEQGEFVENRASIFCQTIELLFFVISLRSLAPAALALVGSAERFTDARRGIAGR